MLYSILSILPMLTCLFWTVTLGVGFGRSDRAKRLLTVFMGLNTVIYLCHCLYFNRVYAVLPVSESVYSLLKLSMYPLYFLYIKLLTEKGKLRVRDFYAMTPAVLIAAACAVIYAMMDDGQREAYLQHVVFGQAGAGDISPLTRAQNLRYKVDGLVFAIQIIPILWLGSRKIALYNREIHNYYSNTEGKTFSEIRTLLIFFMAMSILSLVMNTIGKSYFADSVWMILIPSLLYSTLLYALGYIGSRQNFTAVDFAREVARDEPFGPAVDTGPEPSGLTVSIRELIESHELYRQPDIKISGIAQMLNTNRTYISAALNVELGISFSMMMNGYRVRHAQRLMADAAAGKNTMTRSEIIEQSGFTNKTTFHRAFKAITGSAPQKPPKK